MARLTAALRPCGTDASTDQLKQIYIYNYGYYTVQVSTHVPLGEDTTEYYLLTKDYVSVSEFEGKPILKIEKEGLTAMANAAFRDVSFMLRRSHNEQVAKILSDPEASENDKYVALTFLRNARLPPKAFCPSARIPVRPSSTARKASRSGPDTATKRLSRWAFTKPTPRRTCATRKTLPSRCTKR